MLQRSHARDEGDRRRFVADPDALAALDLKLEQLSDPDVRAVVIRHEHPEFEEALKEGRREIEGSDGPMNPRLHLTMHEVVATQLWDDSPPEVWDTAVRLRDGHTHPAPGWITARRDRRMSAPTKRPGGACDTPGPTPGGWS